MRFPLRRTSLLAFLLFGANLLTGCMAAIFHSNEALEGFTLVPEPENDNPSFDENNKSDKTVRTNRPNLRYEGLCDSDSSVIVQLDGPSGSEETISECENGSWRADIGPLTQPGSHSVQFIVRNKDGVEYVVDGSQKTIDFKLHDLTSALTLVSPASTTSSVFVNEYEINGTCSNVDPLMIVLKFGGSELQTECRDGGSWSFDSVALAHGSHNFDLHWYDAYGNVANHNFQINRMLPGQAILQAGLPSGLSPSPALGTAAGAIRGRVYWSSVLPVGANTVLNEDKALAIESTGMGSGILVPGNFGNIFSVLPAEAD